jgi:hypothetical protein
MSLDYPVRYVEYHSDEWDKLVSHYYRTPYPMYQTWAWITWGVDDFHGTKIAKMIYCPL